MGNDGGLILKSWDFISWKKKKIKKLNSMKK